MRGYPQLRAGIDFPDLHPGNPSRASFKDYQFDLLDHNVNTWLVDEPAKRYLIRTLRGQGDQLGIARAMLSEKYKIHRQSRCANGEGIRRTGVRTEISCCDLTEKRMYVKVRSPEVAAYASRLLENYRSPFSGQRGADNPLLATALTWTNNRPDLSP